ncbi:MAG: isopentenyl-diphosphate Delta-isomerase [Bacteroidetes bacterium]|nr:isopentenyl-diphosphate Delta-isomerase [Bacteroidota bacterium]
MENVILVNKDDCEVGVMEKMEAHQKGLLHRAFSVFLFNKKGEILLQQRAKHKYHSGGLWTNTCCSHPRPGESLSKATQRRLREEMGIKCEMRPAFSFIYKKKFANGLTEHELDHVFLGRFDGTPEINKEEVEAWKYMGLEEIRADLEQNPEDYTAWFKICFFKVYGILKEAA